MTTTTTTKAANRRSTAAAAKRKADAGLRQATFWLTPEAQAKLAKLALHRSLSKEAVINAAILAMDFPPGSMSYGRRVIWHGARGVTRAGATRRWRMEGGKEELDIKFDDASDDAPEWRLIRECEPE